MELPLKRTRQQFTLFNKVQIINYCQENPKSTQDQVASHFSQADSKVSRTTISKILSKKAIIFEKYQNSTDASQAIRNRGGKFFYMMRQFGIGLHLLERNKRLLLGTY